MTTNIKIDQRRIGIVVRVRQRQVSKSLSHCDFMSELSGDFLCIPSSLFPPKRYQTFWHNNYKNYLSPSPTLLLASSVSTCTIRSLNSSFLLSLFLFFKLTVLSLFRIQIETEMMKK